MSEVAVSKIVADFEHVRANPCRASVLEMLAAIARLHFGEAAMSEQERTALEELVFREACVRLGVSTCVLEEARRLLRRCCSRMGCGCLPWGRR